MKIIYLMLVGKFSNVRIEPRSLLERWTGLKVVAEAHCEDEAIQFGQEKQPDVILIDLATEGIEGVQTIRRLKEVHPNGQILALTPHDDQQDFLDIFTSGATGFITEQSTAEEMYRATHAVAEGQWYLQSELTGWLLEVYQHLAEQVREQEGSRKVDEGALEALSKRERQVLEGVAQGLTSPEIGKRLGISPKTVSRHREQLMKKLDLHSAIELVKFAFRTGLIE